MPKLFGLNVVAVIAAAVAFYVIGFLWYGVLFESTWLAASGITKEEAEAGMSPVWMAGGGLITLVQVVGIALVLKWRSAVSLTAALGTAAVVWLALALPILGYSYVYSPVHSSMLLLVDGAHLLVGWGVSAAILSLLKV